MPRFLMGRVAAVAVPIVALVLTAAPCGAQVVYPPDTARAAPGDTTPVPTPAPGPAPATAVVAPLQPVAPPPAVDEVLAAACAGGSGLAEDLLLVMFRAVTDSAGQAAVARSVGGTLAGLNDQGAYYIKTPPDAAVGLNALADRLIQHEAVEMVGPAECPPAPVQPAAAPAPVVAPAPPPAAPADTGAP